MSTVYVGVGSNIEPERNIILALCALMQAASVTGASTFYRTEPVGRPEQESFYNGVFRIETDLQPRQLKETVLQPIEETLGRVHGVDRYAPRTIDLDILLYGGSVIRADAMEIPHPDIYTRRFVAEALLELAPDLVLPDSGRSLLEVVQSLPLRGMTPLPGFTARLRMEIADEP